MSLCEKDQLMKAINKSLEKKVFDEGLLHDFQFLSTVVTFASKGFH